MELHRDVEELLFTKEQIDDIVSRLGKQISADYRGKKLMLVSILKGSVIFMADLMRQISIPCQIDFLQASSYGNGAISSREIKIIKDLPDDLTGMHVLLVEDIIDSGNTMSVLIPLLKSRHAESVKLCSLLDKPTRRETDVTIDYTGAVIEDKFIIGYGLDYAERYRNLPYIGVLRKELYM